MLESILDTLMGNEDNKMRQVNCQEILDGLHTEGYISTEQYRRLWSKYLPQQEN